MSVFFTKSYWKFIFQRKVKSLRIWRRNAFDFSKRKKRLSYILWIVNRSGKGPSWRFWRGWKRPQWTSPRFVRFLFKTGQRPLPLKLAFLALILIPVLGFTIWIGYPMLKEVKAYRLNKTAKAALEAKDYRTAFLTSQSSNLLKPGEAEVLRRLVKTAIILRHPRTMEWVLELANHPEATAEDKLSYPRNCIILGENELAITWMEEQSSLDEASEEMTYLECLARARREAQGEFEAFRIAKSFLAANPGSSRIRDFLWDLCLGSSQPYLVAQGTYHLRGAAKGRDERARKASRRLLLQPSIAREEKKSIAVNLWNLGKPTLTDAILCLDAAYGERKISADKLFFILGQEFDDLHRDSTKGEIIDLLNQVGRPETSLQILEKKNPLSSGEKGRRLRTMRASLSAGDRGTFRELVTDSNRSLSTVEKSFFDFLLLEKGGPSESFEKDFKEILSSADSGDLDSIRSFIHLTDNTTFLLGFISELERRSRDNPGIKYLLATCYRRLGDHEALRKTLLETAMPNSVSNFSGEQQTCFLKASYGQDLDRCAEWAEKALVQYPQSRSTRYALALCYLRMGDSAAALALLRADFASDPPLCPTQRVIGAVALKRSGAAELARKWAPADHLALLLQPEKVLLREALSDDP